MLIPSPRHRDVDLRLWAELEAADAAHAALPGLARKAERSLAEIRAFLAAGPAYCSVSWGKDSVVLAELVRRVAPRTPLAWVRVEPIGNPDCRDVRDAFLARWSAEYHEIVTHCRWSDGQWHATGTLEAGFERVIERVGTDRHLSGLRAEESGPRTVSLRRLGLSTARSCRPLGWWSVADVFAFLCLEGLPVHPAYAMLGGGRWPRQHLRVASFGGRRGDQFGRTEWEREYYGDVINRVSNGPTCPQRSTRDFQFPIGDCVLATHN